MLENRLCDILGIGVNLVGLNLDVIDPAGNTIGAVRLTGAEREGVGVTSPKCKSFIGGKRRSS